MAISTLYGSDVLESSHFITEAVTRATRYNYVVIGGRVVRPFYRNRQEEGRTSGPAQHLGTDITGPGTGDGSLTDPRRGLPVYATMKTVIPVRDLNTARAYSKSNKTAFTGLSIPGTGDATLVEARIQTQPWTAANDESYGGVAGISCVYAYERRSGAMGQFTLNFEFLHLITEQFLPKDETGRIARLSEWESTGRGIGFGPDMQNNAVVSPSFFLGTVFPLIGYLGATAMPHVHVQAAYYSGSVYDKAAGICVDPMVAMF